MIKLDWGQGAYSTLLDVVEFLDFLRMLLSRVDILAIFKVVMYCISNKKVGDLFILSGVF